MKLYSGIYIVFHLFSDVNNNHFHLKEMVLVVHRNFAILVQDLL